MIKHRGLGYFIFDIFFKRSIRLGNTVNIVGKYFKSKLKNIIIV